MGFMVRASQPFMTKAPSPRRSLSVTARVQGRGAATDSSVASRDRSVPEVSSGEGSSRKTAGGKGPRRRSLHPPSALLGLACGVGLSLLVTGPLPQLLGSLMAGLMKAAPSVSGLVAPLGLNQHRILVLGTDQVAANTDVMFTVEVVDGSTRLTQVPRDTFIETDRYGVLKANALYAVGGVEEAKSQVSRLLGIPVDRYVLINLDAVQKLADALGGVEVDVPKRMYYTDSRQDLYIDLYPGVQVLKGEALEGFLRYRNDEMGDLGRMERQQLVLREVFRKLAQPGTVAQYPALIQLASENVRTDLTAVELGALLSSMGSSTLSTSRLAGRLFWQDDLSYWMPDVNTNYPDPAREAELPAF